MLNSGWVKLNKYYSMTDETPAYAASIVLSPYRKWTWIEKNWTPTQITTVKASIIELWKDEYKPKLQDQPPATPPQALTTITNIYLLHVQQLDQQQIHVRAIENEYEDYIASPPLLLPNIKVDPIEWWLEGAQQRQYPNLSQMAIDILSIPAMSAAPERFFSGTKISVTDRRNRLGIASINAQMCLKSWYKVLSGQEVPDFEDIADQPPILAAQLADLELQFQVIEEELDRRLARHVQELEDALGSPQLD
jgi:hypothetical protein